MNISEKINEAIKQAMKEKQKDKLEALRAVKTAFTLARSEKGATSELSDAEELKIIQKLVKQRKDSATIYIAQKRYDLAEIEEKEAEYIKEYLPGQLTEEELEGYLKELISKLGASGMKDMGRVMNQATTELSGKADGKLISGIVRKYLQ